MPKQLIVNADDYGRTPGVSRGIREAYLEGIVTSTSVMINFPAVADDLVLARELCPGMGIGLHLTLTSGIPRLPAGKIPSLVSSNGRFWNLEEFSLRWKSLQLNEIRTEWQAQLAFFHQLMGSMPDHLDAHHHIAYASPALFELLCAMAQEYHLPIRYPGDEELRGMLEWMHETKLPEDINLSVYSELRGGVKSPEALYTAFYDEEATEAVLLDILSKVPEDSVMELMCHPGIADAFLMDPTYGSIYNRQREKELEILCRKVIWEKIVQEDIHLINYSGLL